MKHQKPLFRVISFILTVALLLGMIPAVAAAAEQHLPHDEDYKGFSMENLNNGEWISYDKYVDKQTIFFAPINMASGHTWTKLTFTIEKSQYVALELYRVHPDYLAANLTEHVNDDGVKYTTLPMEADFSDPPLQEDFLWERMGYLSGVSIRNHIISTDPNTENIEDAKMIEANDLAGQWKDILEQATAPGSAKTTASNLYAFGFTGEKYIPPEPEPEEGISALAFFAANEPSMDDAKIQNYFIWDGSYVDGGTVKNTYEAGYYVIVLTPVDELASKYNSFLAFENTSPDVYVAEFNASNYHEPQMTAHELARTIDPVDLLTGSFVWNYTDFALYGKYDLPFTRYYKSTDGQHNYGLGNGWTTNYTADLRIETFFAQATLPGSQKLNFNLNFDHSYQPDGDFTLEWNGNGYTLTNTYTGDVYLFDTKGNVQSLHHTDGSTIVYGYTGNKLTSITGPDGSFALAYNGDGNISTVTDSAGRSIILTYDGDNLISVENPDADSLVYTYTADGYLETVKNFKGQIYVENTYNAGGQVTHQYAANMGTFDFTYDQENRHNTCTGTDGYLLEIWYDEDGRITKSRNAEGEVEITYNDQNLVTRSKDREGNITLYDHDANGNVSKITYADGTSERYVYDANRKVTSYTNRNGVTTAYTYNTQGRVTSSTDGRGNTTTYTYDADGNMVSVTDPLNGETTYTYDGKGNRTSMTDPLGNETTYTYDTQGRLTSQTTPDGSTTTYAYTDAGKLVKITDTEGHELTYTVDGNGFNTSESDWLGNVTAYERNTQNQITKITDPLGNETTYTYDARGNLSVATDAKGLVF